MSTGANPIVGTVWERSAWSVVGRLYNQDGDLITQSMVSSLTYRVYQMQGNSPRELTASAQTIVVADAIFDTLQTNSIVWPEDAIGYNFKWDVPFATIKRAGKFRIEITITPAAGDPYPIVVELNAESLLSR